MKFIAFILSMMTSTGFAISLRVMVPNKDPLNPFKSIESLTYCNLASAVLKTTPLEPLPSRRWQIATKDLKFADGSVLTKEDVITSLAQSSILTKNLIAKLQLKKQILTLTSKIPLYDPKPFLSWPILGARPSRFCGNWKTISGDLNNLKIDNGVNQIHIQFDDQKKGLDELSKGLIDILIPETWTEIDLYLRKNPHINVLTTSKPVRYYFHLNPNRTLSRQTRRDIFSLLKEIKISFPLSKNESHAISNSIQTRSEKDSSSKLEDLNKPNPPHALITSTLAFPEPIRLLKSILTGFKTGIESSSIRVSDELTVEYEIKTNQLDGWLLPEDMPWVNYHSKITSDLYGKAVWSSFELDKLIEENLRESNEHTTKKILNYLENEGLMAEVAELRMIALVGKQIKIQNINESGQGGRFLERLFDQDQYLGK